MFFSMQLVTLPKQMLPKGYQGWVYDFDPFTHYTNTLREIIYMGSHIEMNATIWMMIGFYYIWRNFKFNCSYCEKT